MAQVPSVGNELCQPGCWLYQTIIDHLAEGVLVVDATARITFWNPGAEKLTGFPASRILGTSYHGQLLQHVDEYGRPPTPEICPVMRTLADGEAHDADMYLLLHDGSRLPVSVRVSPIRDADGNVIGAIEAFNDNTEKAAALARARGFEEMAFIDSLTGLGNRRFTEANLRIWLDQMLRYSWPFGVMFVDLDHFKRINDNLGHDIGDEVLKMVGRTMLQNSRPFDVLGRWGGEEFIAIVVNVTEAHLLAIANRFRALVEQTSLDTGQGTVRITVSVGATLARPGDTIDRLIKRADTLMYRSKAAGRNCVTIDES